MLRSRHSWVLRYGISVFASFIALILTQTLWQSIQPALYPFFLAAVMVSSWFGGLGPGFVSTLLGILFSESCFLTPTVIIRVGWEDLGRISYFTSVAVLICVLNARLHHTQRRAEAHALEAQLARQEAETANRAKDEFLAILSHELRTPLTAITGWIGMLRSGRLDRARTNTALETIDRNATLQLQLVEDLLDISRIIRGDLWLDRQPVDLVAVIQESIAIVQPAIEAKRLHFTVAVDLSYSRFSEHPRSHKLDTALVLGDSERLQQVILNLLSNAIKFTPAEGAITVKVSLVDRSANSMAAQTMTNHVANHSISDRSHAVQMQVEDTGIGIKAEFLPHVFDRFRQADSTNTRAYKGLGLGLAIARYLVEQQGGTIQANSLGAGQGATFTVQLPLLTSRDRSHAAQRFDRSPALTLNGVSILVVEDDADTRNWLVHVLEMQQAQVTAVASVDKALAQLAHWLPDVVVSDMAMPGKDGYALMDELKQRETLAGRVILAIALTAYASPEDIEKALTAGFHQHLAKPIKAEALIAAIVRLLEQHSSDQRDER